MANNDGLLTNEEKNTYEKLIESIDNAGLTNETIQVEAEVTANTEKIDNQFVSLNKAIDETLDTLDRGVNQHKGAFDIWKTFGIELDSSAFGQDDANKDRAEKDAIYDQLALLAKALNKDPKLLGTLTSLNNKHLKVVMGKDGEKGYLDQAVKVIGMESGIIDKSGYKDLEGFGAAGFVRLGHSVMASSKIRDNEKFNSTFFHEYGHLILQKVLDDINVEYQSKDDVNKIIDKIKDKISYYKTYTNDLERDIHQNKLLDLQLSGKISEDKYKQALSEMPSIEKANEQIRKANALLEVFKNINNNPEKYANQTVKHNTYINDAHEVFARSFKYYVAGISNITGNKEVDNSPYDIEYTHGANDKINNAFMELFATMEGKSITNNHEQLIEQVAKKQFSRGLNATQLANLLRNIGESSDGKAGVDQLKKINTYLLKQGIDISKYNFSPTAYAKIWNTSLVKKNAEYGNELNKIFGINTEEKMEEQGTILSIDRLLNSRYYNRSDNYKSSLLKLKKSLNEFDYHRLSEEEIKKLKDRLNYIKEMGLIDSEDEKNELNALESLLDEALSKIPSSDLKLQNSINFQDKIKEECSGFNSFETCIKSLADTFKTQFESAIDNSANAFKLAFESAITSYGDVLARVSSGKNPFTADNSTGRYKQEMIMAEHSSGNNKKVTFEEIVKEINQYATPETIDKQLKGLEKSNFQRFIKNMNDAVSTGDEKKKQSVMDSYQKDYVQNALLLVKSENILDKNVEFGDKYLESKHKLEKNGVSQTTIDEFEHRFTLMSQMLDDFVGNNTKIKNLSTDEYNKIYTATDNLIEDMNKALSNHLKNQIKLEVPESVKSSPTVEQTPVVPSGFDVKTWQNEALKQLNQLLENDSKEDYRDKIIDISKQNYSELTGSEFEAAVAEANKFLEDLKQAVANAKPISETVKDTVKETVNSADTVKKTEEIINETVNNTKKSIESGTSDSGKGGNTDTPKEQKPPTKYTGQNFPVEYFGNTARNTNQGVNSNKFIIAGQDENSRPINAEHDKPLTNTGAIIKFDKNAQEWKIDLGDVSKDNSLATLKQIMELNETATHILKHMSDFFKFQFNNKTNPEVTPMEWQNITYKYRSGRLDTKLFDKNYGYFSQNYKIGNEQRSYKDFLDETNNERGDIDLIILQERFKSIGDKIAKANIEGTNPMQTLKWLEEQAEIKAQMVFRTKELIKAERELFREQENQRRKDEKSEKVTLTRNETLDKLKRSLGDFNDKNVHDANNNIVKMGQFGDVAELRHISDMFNTADTLLNASDEEFKQAVKGIVEAINAYKESARRIKMSESDAAKEAKRQEKEIEKMTRDSKKEIKSGIKQADKMLAGDSTYKSIFGKYKIPELSRSGKFSLTDTEKTEVERIKNALKFQETLLGATKTKANQEYIRGEIDKLNAELDNYITGAIADRAKEIAKLEDNYKQKVIPAMEKFNRNIGHIFNTNADIDYEQVRQGGLGKLKELFKFIDLDTMFNKVFNFANLKKSLSGFVSSVKGMFSSGVKMLESAFSKIYGIVSTVIKNITIAITGAVATVTATVTGFVAGFAAMGKSIVGATDVYRKQTIALSGVYKSPVKTSQMINSVYDITRGMPVNYTQAIQTLSEMSAIPVLQNILKSNDSQKSDQLLTKMFKVITAMTTMRPDQNASGAIFSLRNAFAGDLRSLQRRFDLPVANIMNSKGTMGLATVKSDPMAMLDSLENYFDTFLDVETINKVSDTISAIIEKIKGAIDLFKANIGNSGFYDLVARDFRKIRNIVLDFVTSDSGKSFAQRLSDVFSNVYNSIKNMAVKIKDIFSQIFDVKFDSLPEMFTSTLEFFAKSVKYVDNLLDVKTVVDYVQKLLESVEELKKTVAPMIDTIKKKITEVIRTVLNFSITVLEVIGDVVGALKKTGLNDKGLFYLWLFGPGNVISLIGNGLGAVASGITASVVGVGLLAKGFGSVAGFIGIASAKLVLIVGSVTALATALYDLISSFDTYSKIFDTIIDSLKVEFDQMIVELGLPGSNAAKTRLVEGSEIAYRGSVDDVISKDMAKYLEYANSVWQTGNIKTISDTDLSNIIKNNKNDLYYANGKYQVVERAYSGNDYKEHVRFEKETFYLKQFAEYLNGLTDDVSVDMIARQKREKIAEERSKLFGQTKIGKGINAISGAFNGIGGGIDFVKSLFTGDSKGLEGAQNASKTAEQALKDFNKQLESYKNEKGEFDYERFDNDIKAGLVKLTDIKDGIDKIHLDRIGPDQISLNYDKELRSISMDIEKIAYQRTGAFATRFNVDESNKIFNTKHGEFGAGGIEELNLKRLESIQSIYRIAKSYSEKPDMNLYKSMFTIPIAGLSALNKTISINNMIYDTAVKSVDLIRDSLAKKSTTYTPTDIVNYIIAKRKDMENELFEELSNSMKLQYSVYFSTNDELSHYLNDMERKYKGDLNQMMTDISSGNVDMKNLSDMGKSVLTELAERYNAEREYYNNLVSQRMYIEAQNKNIGKMGLGAIKQNWTSLMNSPYKKVRDAAGSRYTDIMNEGLERDDVGSMVRKIRDIAINSFTDMKNAVINAVQEIVKSTHQTIKNGLDKMVMEGGSFKSSFKELGDNIKKNYWGIYTNEIANQVTSFVYGSSMNAEKENPMAGVENSIAELNVNTSNDIKQFQIENDKNFLMVVTSLDKIREVAERIENKEAQKLIHGSVQHQEKMGSMLDSLETSKNISRNVTVSKNNKYDDVIRSASHQYDVPVNLIKAVIQQESSFNPKSVSNKGAIGLMQVIPETANYVNNLIRKKNPSHTNLNVNVPEENIMLGTKYLAEQIKLFKGDIKLALAAYNAGPGRVIDAGNKIPNIPETQDYVPKVLAYYEKFGGYTEPSSNLESISRTGHTETNDTIISVNKEELSYVKGIFEAVKNGIQSTVSVYAPVINNITSGISGVETITDAFGGFDMTSMLGSSNPINGIASGISGNKYVQLASKALPGVGNIVNMLSGKKTLTEYSGKSVEKETPLKGIFGTLFGTVENVESKFGGAGVGSFLGTLMSGKGIVDSLGAVALKTFGKGTDGAKMIAGSNTLTKGLTGLTSTLFGKSAGQSVAKFLGKSFLGTTVGTALPVIGTVAKVLSGKGWYGGAKDRTAEGRARGEEFNTLRSSLISNRNTMARNYYMANSDTIDALNNYEFGTVAMWTSTRGHKHKGTKRRIMNTDATAFTNSMIGYWDLLEKADKEQRAMQVTLNKLQNTNNMEYLKRTGEYEETRYNSVKEDLEKYKEAVSKYAGHDTGFKQKLFDGKEYTLTELNDKVNDLIKELGDSNDAIAQNTEAIRQEKLATEDAKLDYETALYGKFDPLISYTNELKKLENEWQSVVNDDGTVGYKEDTKEWYQWNTKLLQASENLEEATENLKNTISTDWISSLKTIQLSNGNYDSSQVKTLKGMYTNQTTFNDYRLKSMGKLETAIGDVSKTQKYSDNISDLLWHWGDEKVTGTGMKFNAITNLSNLLNSIGGRLSDVSGGTSVLDTSAYFSNKGTYATLTGTYDKDSWMRYNYDYYDALTKIGEKYGIGVNSGSYLTRYDADKYKYVGSSDGKDYWVHQNVLNDRTKINKYWKEFTGMSYDQFEKQYAQNRMDTAYASNVTQTLTGVKENAPTSSYQYLVNTGQSLANTFLQEGNITSTFKVTEKKLIDSLSLVTGKNINELPKIVEKAFAEAQKYMQAEIEHYKANTAFKNTVRGIMEGINNIFDNVDEKISTKISENIDSILLTITESDFFIKENGYQGYDQLNEEVILPLIQSIGNNFNDMASVYANLTDSGYVSQVYNDTMQELQNSLMDKLIDFQEQYRIASMAGASEKELQEIVNNAMKTTKGLKGINELMIELNDEFASAQNLLYQSNAKTTVLGSLSGYDDYEIGNTALKEFNDTLGKNAMNKLLGVQNGMTDFSDETMSKWFGVSGEDPYETYYEYQKKTILQRIKNEKEGSEEWYNAELDLWNLMQENAKYLKDKAEKTTASIEEMLGKIEETAKMRVAEEAKSQKGDIIFFDLGASRNGTQFINSMLKAIKTNDPDAQKLIAEFKKKNMGV